jgi:hypothetical protein
MKYYCKQCKLAVIVYDGKTIKACKCDAPIIADATVTLHSTSTCGNNGCQDLKT